MTLPTDGNPMAAVLNEGPNWRAAWKNSRENARTVIVLMFVACDRNLRRTAEALKMSLSTLQRFRAQDPELRAATEAKAGRPPTKGATAHAEESGE